jgi:hypothetical protein
MNPADSSLPVYVAVRILIGLPGKMDTQRRHDLVSFYAIFDNLEKDIGGARKLADSSGRLAWPKRGIYFFREPGQHRSQTGTGPRIVRVGTHALKAASTTELWTRLSQHKGQPATGGGNHRGSIFRLLIGAALIRRDGFDCPTWGIGNTASRDVRDKERALEREVSKLIGNMPFLWLSIEDDPGPQSLRGYIERNSIARLSNYDKPILDPPSQTWLGHYSHRERVRKSGLWNQNHVDELYDPMFLRELDRLVAATAVAP